MENTAYTPAVGAGNDATLRTCRQISRNVCSRGVVRSAAAVGRLGSVFMFAAAGRWLGGEHGPSAKPVRALVGTLGQASGVTGPSPRRHWAKPAGTPGQKPAGMPGTEQAACRTVDRVWLRVYRPG